MLPRPPAAAVAPTTRRAIPRRSCAAGCILYRAYRDAGRRLADARWRFGIGLFRREPRPRRRPAVPARDRTVAAPLDPAVARPTPSPARPCSLRRRPSRRPRSWPRTITLDERAAIIRAALRGAPSVVLQELLRDVRDRVVVAVTFLAMLELVKRREIVVEQDEPWGPIVARATTAAGAGGGRIDRGQSTTRSTNRCESVA